MKSVAGIYENTGQLHQALERLDREAGGSDLQMRLVVGDDDAAYATCPENDVAVLLGRGVGIGVGSLFGWAAGLFATRSLRWLLQEPLEMPWNLDEPGLVAASVLGALLCGLVGTHAGRRFEELEAQAYKEEVVRGSIVFALDVPDTARVLWVIGILQGTGADRIRFGRSRRESARGMLLDAVLPPVYHPPRRMSPSIESTLTWLATTVITRVRVADGSASRV